MKKPDANTLIALILIVVATGALFAWMAGSSGGGKLFGSAKDSPDWGVAQERADSLLQRADGTPNLKDLILSKYQGKDDIASYLLHDTSGRIATNLLVESKEELKAYQDYLSAKYAYQTKIESNCLAIYKDGQELATVPISYTNEHK